jgi:hypothetical protein
MATKKNPTQAETWETWLRERLQTMTKKTQPVSREFKMDEIGELLGIGGNEEGVTKAGPEKGKKSTRWDDDLKILLRLEVVASMMAQNASLRQIAAALNYSTTTARKDLARVRTIWRKVATEKLEKARARSVAVHMEIESEMWNIWRAMNTDEKKRGVHVLRTVIMAEKEVASLQGTIQAPEQTLNLKGTAHAKDPLEDKDSDIILGHIEQLGKLAGALRGAEHRPQPEEPISASDPVGEDGEPPDA